MMTCTMEVCHLYRLNRPTGTFSIVHMQTAVRAGILFCFASDYQNCDQDRTGQDKTHSKKVTGKLNQINVLE